VRNSSSAIINIFTKSPSIFHFVYCFSFYLANDRSIWSITLAFTTLTCSLVLTTIICITDLIYAITLCLIYFFLTAFLTLTLTDQEQVYGSSRLNSRLVHRVQGLYLSLLAGKCVHLERKTYQSRLFKSSVTRMYAVSYRSTLAPHHYARVIVSLNSNGWFNLLYHWPG